MHDNTLHSILVALLPIPAGILGGLVAILLMRDDDTNLTPSDRKRGRNVVLGVTAAFLVPLFLKLVSSDLIENDDGGLLSAWLYMAYAGMCLIAAISSRGFISSVSRSVLAQVQEAREAVERRADAVEKQHDEVVKERVVTEQLRDETLVAADRTEEVRTVASDYLLAAAASQAPGTVLGIGPRHLPGEIRSNGAGISESIIDPDDPVFGRFGGSPRSETRELQCTVTPFGDSGRFYKVVLRVVPIDGSTMSGSVELHLHPTFPAPVRTIEARPDGAELTVIAYECFTAGAIADDGSRLELRMCEDASTPAGFRVVSQSPATAVK